MKKIIISVGIAGLLVACGTTKTTTSNNTSTSKTKKEVTEFANSITSNELKEMLYTYASDEFEGRLTGSSGQKKAVEFIKKHYVDLGIVSPLGGDDYFQEVPLQMKETPTIDLSINGKTFEINKDMVSVRDGNEGVISLDQIAYVGYGIEEGDYSDYRDLDVTGKYILIKGGEPKNEDGNYVISGTDKASKWSTRQQYSAKSQLATSKGAKGILLYDEQIYPMIVQMFSRGGSYSIKGDAEVKDKMHYLFVNNSVAEAIVSDIATNNKPTIVKTSLHMNYKNNSKDVASENVIAYIKGSEKPDEVIVISAHLDHEGVKDGKIYNGADDDGSGTVAILEIAEAFKEAVNNGQGPKRSVVFLHVTGEEKGLLGSQYYADMDPIFPLENTVANLNIDMVGRTDPKRESKERNYVYLIGSDRLSTELHTISEEINKKYTNLELDYTFNDVNDPNQFYYRSDHYNFAKNDIPVIFYFNGTHDDYHQPSDTPDKIQYDLLQNRARLIFHTAWELANRDARIVVDKPTKKAE